MKKLLLALAILGASLCHAQVDTSKYDFIGDFSDGLAVVELNGKYGFINQEGEEITPLVRVSHSYPQINKKDTKALTSGGKDLRFEV